MQFTEKIYRVAHALPRVITALVSKDKLEFKEISYNGYPDQRTYSYSEHGDAFRLELVSKHAQDNGKQENIHGLDKDLLAKREVINIDIAAPHTKEYTKETDPALWTSKTGRGPLEPGTWMDRTDIPVMTCYKLVAMQLKWFGFQSIVQNTFIKYQKNMFIKFHRELCCGMDNWVHMSMEDIRAYEDEVQKKLEEAIKSDEVKLYTSTDVEEKSPTAADTPQATTTETTTESAPAEATTTEKTPADEKAADAEKPDGDAKKDSSVPASGETAPADAEAATATAAN